MAVLTAVMLAAGGSVAYACGGPAGNGCKGSGCPSGGVYWTSSSTPVSSASYVRCTVSIVTSTNTLVEGAANLAPGQSCAFVADLLNTEKQSVSIKEKVTPTLPAGCRLYAYLDNVASSSPPVIASGHFFVYKGTLSLSKAASNRCEVTHATFSVVIEATPYEKCSGGK